MERTEEEVRSRRGAGRLGLQRGHGGMGWRGHVRLILLKDRAAAELMVVRSPRKPPTVHSYSGGTRTSRRHAAWQAPPASALSRSRARTRRSPRHMARMTTGANGVQPEVHAEHNARTQSAGAYVGEVRARGAGQLGAPGHAAPKQWCFPIRSLMLGRNRRLHPIQTRRKKVGASCDSGAPAAASRRCLGLAGPAELAPLPIRPRRRSSADCWSRKPHSPPYICGTAVDSTTSTGSARIPRRSSKHADRQPGSCGWHRAQHGECDGAEPRRRPSKEGRG